MKTVFIDTGGFFAALASSDRQHHRARELLSLADAENWTLITTNAVLYETHALLLNRGANGRAISDTFLEAMERGLARVERVSEDDERDAVDLIRPHHDKKYSLCDATSFVVMERLGIADVIAFDHDFRSYGRFNML